MLSALPTRCWRTLSQDSLIAVTEVAHKLLQQDDNHLAHLLMLLAGQWHQLYQDAQAAANWETAQALPALGGDIHGGAFAKLLQAASQREDLGKAWKQILSEEQR